MSAQIVYTDNTTEQVVIPKKVVRQANQISLTMSVENALFLQALIGGTRLHLWEVYDDLFKVFGVCPDGYSGIPDPLQKDIDEIRRRATEFVSRNSISVCTTH